MLNFKENYYSFKNGEKLFAAAMQGIPDRVPVYAQLHEFAMNELGVLAKDFYTTPEILIPGCLEISERYGIDVAFLDYDVYNIEVEGLGQEVIFFDDHIPDVDRSKPFITGPDDLKKIKTPDFDTAGRFSKVIEMLTLFEKLTDVNPILQFCAPFSMAANLCGIEKLIMGIFKNPGFIRDLFDAIVEEVLIPWIMYQKKYFPNASSISGSDATASLPILNMRILEEWVVPYILRLRDACGQEVNVPNWVGEKYLKKPEELLMLKLQASPDYIEGQDPDVAALGPGFYKAYAENQDVPLVLGIGAGFIDRSTPEQVRERVKQYVEVGGKNGRFALYLCNLSAATPPENVTAAIETAHACFRN